MARAPRTATERSRARRYRARLPRLSGAEFRWLTAYVEGRTLPEAAPTRASTPLGRLARALAKELSRFLFSEAGIVTAETRRGASDGTSADVTIDAPALLAVAQGDDVKSGPILSADWSRFCRGSKTAAALASALQKVSPYFDGEHRPKGERKVARRISVRALIRYTKARDAMTSWTSLLALTALEESRVAIPDRLSELATVASDVRIDLLSWNVKIVELTRTKRPERGPVKRGAREWLADPRITKRATSPKPKKRPKR